jgi:hypothetical protein
MLRFDRKLGHLRAWWGSPGGWLLEAMENAYIPRFMK